MAKKQKDWQFKQTGDFYKDLALRESTGNHEAENDAGYIGLYQFGEDTLMDTGYYKKPKSDPSKQKGGKYEKWTGTWTGKNGIRSKDDFLNNPIAQEIAVREYHDIVWNRYLRDYQKYEGQTIGGIALTKTGMLGMAHLVGHGQLKKFIDTNGREVKADGNGTLGTEYLSGFANHNFNNSIAELKKQLEAQTIAIQQEQNANQNMQGATGSIEQKPTDTSKQKFIGNKNADKHAMLKAAMDKLHSQVNKKVKDYREQLEKEADAEIDKIADDLQKQLNLELENGRVSGRGEYSAYAAKKQAEHDAEFEARCEEARSQLKATKTKSTTVDSSDIASKKQAELDMFKAQLQANVNSKLQQVEKDANANLKDKIADCTKQQNKKLADKTKKINDDITKQLEKWFFMPEEDLANINQDVLDKEIAMVLQGVDADLLV